MIFYCWDIYILVFIISFYVHIRWDGFKVWIHSKISIIIFDMNLKLRPVTVLDKRRKEDSSSSGLQFTEHELYLGKLIWWRHKSNILTEENPSASLNFISSNKVEQLMYTSLFYNWKVNFQIHDFMMSIVIYDRMHFHSVLLNHK